MRRTPEDIQDELLVLQCQDGDRDSLRALHGRWQPRFVGLAWRLTTDREATQDIVQDAWLAIVRGLRRLDDPARFRVWAYRIVSNKCADWHRRRVVQRRAECQAVVESISRHEPGEVDSGNDVDQLREAMTGLSHEHRAVLALHYLEMMSIAEIGHILGVPSGTVRSRLHYARNQLKQVIERTQP